MDGKMIFQTAWLTLVKKLSYLSLESTTFFIQINILQPDNLNLFIDIFIVL